MSLSLGIGLGISFGGVPATGAIGLLGSEPQGMAIDFTDMSMVILDTGTPSNNFSGNPNTKLSYGSPSAKNILSQTGVYASASTIRTEYSAAGTARGVRIEEARTNLFLNSRAPVTQNISVTAIPYALSFLGTGTITLSGASTAGPLVGTGALDRDKLTFTPSAGTLTLTCSGSLDYVQLEGNAIASSPIVTAGSSVLRAADNISIATTLFPFSATAGTVLVKAYATEQKASGGRSLFSLDDQTSNERIQLQNGAATQAVVLFVADGGATQVNNITPANSFTLSAAFKAAVAFALNDFAVALNAGTVVTDTSATLPTPTRLAIGEDRTNGAIADMWLQQILYLPRRASNAEIQALTT